MSTMKADIEIGQRAFAELMRIFKTPKKAIMRTGISKSTLYKWKEGYTPNGLGLLRMHYAGADVIYILTGKRSKTEVQ